MVRNDDVERAAEVLTAIVERELALAATIVQTMIDPRIDELLAHTSTEGVPRRATRS